MAKVVNERHNDDSVSRHRNLHANMQKPLPQRRESCEGVLLNCNSNTVHVCDDDAKWSGKQHDRFTPEEILARCAHQARTKP